jgi:hypothetical protein
MLASNTILLVVVYYAPVVAGAKLTERPDSYVYDDKQCPAV